ncbi:MAG: DNA repair protein RecN [Dehalococcoidales bacterium]|nr:DNA repair protein RecN [Dehalococcoidales bacterium]
MLLELSVKNFGIIEKITWKPVSGLNVITGETGAGKSLVVDAMEALLSGQANDEDIRTDTTEAEVEGIFSLPENNSTKNLQALLTEKEIETDDDSLIFSCVFRRQSRTTPRINRQAVSRALLREIGSFLVDIHGQSGHLSLLDKDQHMDFLDGFGHTRALRQDFSEKVAALTAAEKELQSLIRNERDLSRQIDLLNFQINEISRAELVEGEDEELETELTILSSAEKLKATAYEIYSLLSSDDNPVSSTSATDRLSDALPLLGRMLETDPSLKDRYSRLESVGYELAEIADEIKDYGERLDYNPERMDEVQGRLELIRTLKRKYGNSITEILEYLVNAEQELEGLTFSGERKEYLEGEIGALRHEMGAMAFRLSKERIKAAEKLEKAVRLELDDLEMTGVVFKVALASETSDNGIPFPDGSLRRYNSTGADDIEFMASTNPGESLKPLAKIASTGEISRFMLALKCALAESDTIPVLVFDEIDIGVGGRSGEIIGRKLWNLSRTHQVTCVTHLPQIAAFADAHFSVTKAAEADRTVSNIRSLDSGERLNEIAVMLSGPHITRASLNSAREIIQQAEKWKVNPVKTLL